MRIWSGELLPPNMTKRGLTTAHDIAASARLSTKIAAVGLRRSQDKPLKVLNPCLTAIGRRLPIPDAGP
ncbi:protein of unknown function [Hyphomicrobium sp. MC1]|nr:protein of unknown function [Hyphomicrobium sp. MC1]